MPTSGVEVKSTNSATFYVTGSRPTSVSPNQELLHLTGEMPPGGFCGNNMVQERVPVMTGPKVYQPNTSCVTTGKNVSAARPQSAHGAPGQRREMYVVPPRPASVNANPFPGVIPPENSPPKPNCIQNVSRKQSRPVSTAAATTAAAVVSATTASSPPAPMNYPPPPQYPGTGISTNASTRTKNELNSASINANGTKNMAINKAQQCKQQQQLQHQQQLQQQGAIQHLSATPIISPTASANTSPNISTATSPVVSSNSSSPISTTNPASGQILSLPESKSAPGSMKNEFCQYEMLERAQRTRSQPDLLCLNNEGTSPARLSLPSANTGILSSGQRTPSPQPSSLKHGNQQK